MRILAIYYSRARVVATVKGPVAYPRYQGQGRIHITRARGVITKNVPSGPGPVVYPRYDGQGRSHDARGVPFVPKL